MPKREIPVQEEDVGKESTPKKKQRTIADNSLGVSTGTPSKRKSILRNTPTHTRNNNTIEAKSTPNSLRRVLFSTPSKPADTLDAGAEAPITARNARSAQKKSAKAVQKYQIAGDVEEDGVIDRHDPGLAREILEIDDSEDYERIEGGAASLPPPAAVKKRGRPKGRRRDRTPSPPPDLEPHELYFFHHRAGGNKTSANTLPSNLLLGHEDLAAHIRSFVDPHEADLKSLNLLHHRAFDQWMFELREGFNVCLYGYGSKHDLVLEFAGYIHQQAEQNPQVLIVNGYTPGITARDILSFLGSTILAPTVKLPVHPAAALDRLLAHLDEYPLSVPVIVLIHSLDHANLRKPGTQSLFARLATHSSVGVLATCDTPNFSLLWDATQQRQFRWLYHDTTTFAPYAAEIDVIDDVNLLLGRSTRRFGGKDGIVYVLRSLPENARTLFRILVAEQLAASGGDIGVHGYASDDESLIGLDDEDEEAAIVGMDTPSRKGRGRQPKVRTPRQNASNAARSREGVEYRTLYHKAVEEFVCSNEVSFRTLLKEFHDHQMIESRKDGMGTERLVVPFGRAELEEVLEDLI